MFHEQHFHAYRLCNLEAKRACRILNTRALIGRQSVVGFLTSIMPLVKRIQIKQHLVDGEFVATMFDMETDNGTDKVFDWLHVSGGQLKAIRSFYYPHIASWAAGVHGS
jgi:hypothetical protein